MRAFPNPWSRRLRGRPLRLAGAAASLALAAAVIPAAAASAGDPPPECTGTPMQVTADCVDPLYANPVIDAETDETTPVAHHRVSGHFEGTDIQFNIYLPPADEWGGRFFQWTYPTAFTATENTAVASDRAIGFAIASGGYAVQAGSPYPVDSLGYRHDAAAAKFAAQFAAAYYGTDQHIYGYLYGGSGGSYQTIGAAENVSGAWDGFLPYIIGTPMSTPYNFFIRSFADLVLADKADQIKAAVSPGGSGDPYAGLDPAETAMLRELTAFGIPLQAWENPDYVLGHAPYFPDGLLGFGPIIKMVDSGYVDAFWNSPGYLGSEDSPLGDVVRSALADAGHAPADCTGGGAAPSACWDIALPVYYRYQLPPASAGYVGFDQFRAADGTALYPQRPLVWGPLVIGGTSGNASYDGSINGKMIIVDNLYDSDALATPADWYAQKVEASLGAQAYANTVRVYYTDHADHQEAEVSGERATYLVTFWGQLEQGLRDLAAWVEDGVEPPASTQYSITDGQVVVPADAHARLGLQPTVDLTVRRSDTVTIKVGQQAVFHARVEAAPGTGTVAATAWDYEGDGIYVEQAVKHPRATLQVQSKHRFTKPGVYYVALRVTVQRDGVDGPYAKVENLDRVRVVVTGGHADEHCGGPRPC